MNDFEKILEKKADDSVKESESVVKEVKLLLTENAQEEISTLRSIGLDNEIHISEIRTEDILTRSKNKDRYGRTIVSIDDIKSVCRKYRMYMLSANQYRGPIPPDLGADLNRFCKEKNIPLSARSDYSNFFVIAPPKMFKGYQTPAEVFGVALLESERKVKTVMEEFVNSFSDPILAYQLPENPKYFAIVRSWGKDFTPLRRVYGFFTTDWMMKVNSIVLLLAVNALCGYAAFELFKFTFTTQEVLAWRILTFAIALAFVAIMVVWTCFPIRKEIRQIVSDKRRWSR